MLPLLVGGRLVGRADLKMERKERRLRCPALHLDAAADPADAAAALRALAERLGADEVAVDRVEPPARASALADHLA